MIAVIYYAYGAPKSIDEVEAYFSHILKGKPVPESLLSKIIVNFKNAGFPDFIRSSTERIASGLEWLLNKEVDEKVRVYVAYKHTAPFVKDAYEAAVQAGATTIVTLSVNPILSASGGGAVHTEVAELNQEASIAHFRIDDYHLDTGLIQVFADRVRRAFDWLSKEAQSSAYVLFTVHSQPIDSERNAEYVKQFKELAAAIATSANINRYEAVFRSGHSAGWLGPDVKEAIRELTLKGVKGFVTCELLSISADVESYKEINDQCQQIANQLNVEFSVSEFLGDSFDTVVSIAELIKSRI